METAYIKTPLGIAKLEENQMGIAVVKIGNTDEPISIIIPKVLEDSVYQLNQYFEGKRDIFTMNLNPTGTDFQKRVWKALLKIP